MATVVLVVVGLMSVSRYLAEYDNTLRNQAVTAGVLASEVIELISLGVGGGNYANVRDEAAIQLYASESSLRRFSARGTTDGSNAYALFYDSELGGVFRMSYEPQFDTELKKKLKQVSAKLEESPDHPQYLRLQQILKRRERAYLLDMKARAKFSQLDDCRRMQIDEHRFLESRLELHLLKRTRNRRGGSICLVFDASHLATLPSRLLEATAPTALVGVLVGLVLVLLFALLIIRPLEALTVFVQETEVSALTPEQSDAPGADRQDEVGVLARSFTDLMTEIQGQFVLLESKTREAESASLAKTQFLASVSHEVRTPLNGIIGMTELALQGPLEESKREDLQTVLASSELLLTIINDILDYSKIEAEKVELEILDTELHVLLEQTLKIVGPRASVKGVALLLELDPDLPQVVRVDPVRMKQVLLNLLGNAVKFTEQGQVLLRVTREGTQTVRFEVQDTGIGIPKEAQQRLFERFQQADLSTTRKYGGSGLGLSICRGLVEGAMDGRIGLESTPGEGSTFWFEIALEEGCAKPKEEAPESAGLATEGIKLRILVADDNAVNRVVASRMLSHLGHEVELAVDGVDAVNKVREGSFALVFMDWQMPRLDGLSATRRIREMGGEWAQLPIIGLTANVAKEDRALCMAAGMVDILPKPVRMEELSLCVQQWGASRSTERSSRRC